MEEGKNREITSREELQEKFNVILPYFGQRGTEIFNCADAWLIQQGFSSEADQDDAWKGVKPNESLDIEPNDFNRLVADLKKAGFDDVVLFVEDYVADPQKYEAMLRAAAEKRKEEITQAMEQRRVAGNKAKEELIKPIEKKEEPPCKMNIFNNYNGVLEGIVALEKLSGSNKENWLRLQSDPTQDLTLSHALKEVKKGGTAVVYGYGGWNRYVVGQNGDMHYSKFHGSAEQAIKAEEMGFKIT